MVDRFYERDYLIPYTIDGVEKVGCFSADLQKSKGLLVINSPGNSPLFFLRKKDNGLEQIVLWPCTSGKSGEMLKVAHNCKYDPYIKRIADAKIPTWLKTISANLQADCSYYQF